jgi:hypothetical protein
MAADSNHVTAIYNAACTAALLGQPAKALEYLKLLKAKPGKLAAQYLAKASSDHDFDGLRADANFSAGVKSLQGK